MLHIKIDLFFVPLYNDVRNFLSAHLWVCFPSCALKPGNKKENYKHENTQINPCFSGSPLCGCCTTGRFCPGTYHSGLPDNRNRRPHCHIAEGHPPPKGWLWKEIKFLSTKTAAWWKTAGWITKESNTISELTATLSRAPTGSTIKYMFSMRRDVWTRISRIKWWRFVIRNIISFPSHGHPATGYFIYRNNLYYADSKGRCYLNRSRENGQLYFTSSGAARKNTAALLKMQTMQTVSSLTSSNMTKAKKLRACWNYIVSWRNFSYGGSDPNLNQKGWYRSTALKMLQTKRGNCYSFACAFAAMAKEVGYKNIKIVRGIWPLLDHHQRPALWSPDPLVRLDP